MAGLGMETEGWKAPDGTPRGAAAIGRLLNVLFLTASTMMRTTDAVKSPQVIQQKEKNANAE